MGTKVREEEKEGAHLNRYFLSRLPLLSFSPYYQNAWCQTWLMWGERRDTKCRQILKVAADYFKRRKYPLLLWGLPLIRLSTAGVKEGTQVHLSEKYKQVMHSSGHPPSARPPLEQSSSTAFSSSLVSMYHVTLISTVLQLGAVVLLQFWMHQTSLMFNLEWTPQPWAYRQPISKILMSHAARTFMQCQRKRVGMRGERCTIGKTLPDCW